MKKLTIQRSRWIRGSRDGSSYLYREDDRKMCCLGFYLRSCGVKVQSLMGIATPRYIIDSEEIPKQAQWLVFDPGSFDKTTTFLNSDACIALIDANDKRYGSRSKLKAECQREERIKALFAVHNVEVTFID